MYKALQYSLRRIIDQLEEVISYMLCIYWLYITPYFQTEGDNLSLSETLTSETASVTGAETQTPNTLRKGEQVWFLVGLSLRPGGKNVNDPLLFNEEDPAQFKLLMVA